MYRSILFLAGWLVPVLLQAQPALHNNGATLNITTGTSLVVNGDLTNSASSTITNDGSITITGNVTNDATINSNTSSMIFSGTSPQTVSGTATVEATDVQMNNALGVTLSTPLRVDGTLTFMAGMINATTAGAPLILAPSGVATGASDASHVNGYVRREGTGSFTYPVGDATNYQPVTVNLSANSAGLTARYMAGDVGAVPYAATGTESSLLYAYNAAEYWDLSPVGTSTGTVTLSWDGYNNPGMTATIEMRVAHKTGGLLLNEGSASTVTGTLASGTVTSNPISTWSPFTLGKTPPLGITGSAPLSGAVTLYPLPATTTLNIRNTSPMLLGTQASVVDVLGREVARFTMLSSRQLDIRTWAPGSYTLRLSNGTGMKILKVE